MTETTDWQKSSFSGPDNNQHCVELAPAPHGVRVRESDAPEVVVTASTSHLRGLLHGVKAGVFDDLI